MKKYLLPLTLILLLAFTLTGFTADLYGTYDQRIKFTVDNSKIDAELTHFPITLFLTDSQMEEVFAEFDSDDDFDRCAVTTDDESTQIYGDCELFDDSESLGIYHAAKTGVAVSNSTTTDFYYYYDKDAAHNTTYISKSGGTAAQSVYDANFKAVYHMNDFSSWTTQYEATIEPDSDGWTLGGSDYASVSAGILTIDTSGNGNNTCYYYKTPDINFDTGFYLKIRVEASTDMAAGDYLYIRIHDGTQNERVVLTIGDGRITWIYTGDGWDNADFDTTTDYVTYEIYVKGTTFWIYADEVQKGTNTVDGETVSDLVQFGDDKTDIMCKAEIDYVYYALDVTSNPLLSIFDSTSNANHGTKKAINEPVEIAGKVGQGQDFEPTDDYISGGDILEATNNFTVEAIFKADDLSAARTVASKRESAGSYEGWQLRASSDTTIFGFVTYDGDDINRTATVNSMSTDPHYIAMAITNLVGQLYLDGATAGTTSTATGNVTETNANFSIGAMNNAATFMDGILDEIRISDTGRNAAWIKATYNSLWDSLLTYGAEETPTGITWNGVVITKWNGITITKINGK